MSVIFSKFVVMGATVLDELYVLFRKHKKVSTDTRELVSGSIFFALKGDKFNGNKFAEKALEKGAAYAVVDDRKVVKGDKYILVPNVLKALKQIAVRYRMEMLIPVIGITGTNGKTTTKELITAVLSKRYRVHATSGNLNNHIGVPLTLLSMPDDTEIAVIEMGASRPSEISELCKICIPTYGLITNISNAHLEGFGTFEKIIDTKGELYRAVERVHGKLFVNKDNPLLRELSGDPSNCFFYGTTPPVYAQVISIGEHSVHLHAKLFGTSTSPNAKDLITSLVGSYNLENVAAACCIGRYFGLTDQQIKEGIESYKPENMRSQIIHTQKNTVILDAYNANPTSMYLAVDNFAKMYCSGDKYIVLGDMLEMGENSLDDHKKIVKQLQENSDFRGVFLAGDNFVKASKGTPFKSFKDVAKLSTHIRQNTFLGAFFLVKGSRGLKMEKVLEAIN
ncbi:MAG: UDP-N-acetylmuramoyl-tripeptide--D-alanyl-D-alanine ligase [Bacteroidales bacterium]|jgi:UDP-N-acetylmuramoyl-tripeptide--D-alanyl-D-alanine ligase|nr:UDP-N-acetylmuramoyl-tripeptide--D-alanyl-D-alanine ligase [Bacteroidales bacterium]